MYPVRERGVLEAVGLDFWTKDPTCIWIVNQRGSPKKEKGWKKEKKENKEDKRSDHQIFNRSKHKGTDHVPKSTKVLDTSIHPIGLFFSFLDQLLHASAIFIRHNVVDIGQPGFQGPTQLGQREAKDALLRSFNYGVHYVRFSPTALK